MSSEVAQPARQWKAARDQVHQQRKVLVDAVKAAHSEGMSEYELARQVGVGRGTIREWLGKAH